ncbi:hypothetical protein O0I10_007849 [Lichtheimia ornata]|uniref:Uncharacterized protein n=1 Tax=Lichtheimia ornata TaxID=688661 RepID=A0AAD7XXJ7_9FUNG|nr:uncharacterized protein O0I10_007849 [Lichtheimia ornata]KAJ8656526.1 hypothetical protein O0I10_007849 [Lichtheimia ornata]
MNNSSNVQQHQPYTFPDYDIIQQEEESYFGDYDRAVAAAALTADYYDSNYDQYHPDGFVEQEDENVMELDQEDDQQRQGDENNIEHLYNYQEDSLLHLIVGVQSYLSDMANAGIDRNDSPLLDLQYKMYTYLKQRACDMGVDAENLC